MKDLRDKIENILDKVGMEAGAEEIATSVAVDQLLTLFKEEKQNTPIKSSDCWLHSKMAEEKALSTYKKDLIKKIIYKEQLYTVHNEKIGKDEYERAISIDDVIKVIKEG